VYLIIREHNTEKGSLVGAKSIREVAQSKSIMIFFYLVEPILNFHIAYEDSKYTPLKDHL